MDAAKQRMMDKPVTKENVRACPTRLISEGDRKHSRIKPIKMKEPINPISVRENPIDNPDSASKGPSVPVLT